jgi:D-tyrosyl-tRNA(Tyr) deacylase
MKAVIQRVSRASVEVEGKVVATIGCGLLVLVGIEGADTAAEIAWLADKLANLRVFEDSAGKMNLSVKDVGESGARGEILLVPNFTVAGDSRKGRRPSFDSAMRPEQAEPSFAELVKAIAAQGVPVQAGIFRAHMLVSLVNDGPVTILLESARRTGG